MQAFVEECLQAGEGAVAVDAVSGGYHAAAFARASEGVEEVAYFGAHLGGGAPGDYLLHIKPGEDG